MALSAGNAACSSGLSKRIYDYWTGDTSNGFSGSMSGAQTDAVKSLCYAIARAVVDEVTANGVAEISTSLGALQQVGGADTTAPTSTRTIPLR